jgi:hypothetical protein
VELLTRGGAAVGVFQDDCGFRVQHPGRWTISGARIAGCGRQGGRERKGAQGSACIADMYHHDWKNWLGSYWADTIAGAWHGMAHETRNIHAIKEIRTM